MIRTRVRILTLTTLLALLPGLAAAQGGYRSGGTDDAIRLRIGLLDPDWAGSGDFWADKSLDFTGSASDFKDTALGIDYLRELGPRTGLMLTLGLYEGEVTQAYRDFTDASGRDIRHLTTLDTAELSAAFIFRITRRAPVSPYLGVGGGFWFWQLEEAGDFIDFSQADPEIFASAYRSEGTALGYYGLAGVEVGLNRSWSFLAEARFKRVDDELGDDHAGLGTLTLDGAEYTAGFAWRF